MTFDDDDSPTDSGIVKIDYQKSLELPKWIRAAIDEHLAIESEDARSAGALGFMARALVLATMPYKDPKTDVFTRRNGNFKLRIVAGYEGGIPFGIYPRLLMSWVTTEAVRTQDPVLRLGDSLSAMLRDVLDLRTSTGGNRGTATRVVEQMARLFGAYITAQHGAVNSRAGFEMTNLAVAERVSIKPDYYKRLVADLGPAGAAEPHEDGKLWTPQQREEAGQWQSVVRLTQPFFRELITSPVPIDTRAYKVLRGSPMAMDQYTWLTYRNFYTKREAKPIRWESLMGQFGVGLNVDKDHGQAVRDFRKAFLKAFRAVSIVYPDARLNADENGVTIVPGKPHIPPLPGRPRPVLSRPAKPKSADDQGKLF